MVHIHGVRDGDALFTINPATRAIKGDPKQKTVLIQNDHNSERFSFTLPRYIESHDMSVCNKVEVHFLNIDTVTKESRSGVYTVDDLHIRLDPDGEFVGCSWLISNNATSLAGSLAFMLRFACTSGTVVDYAWNTAIYTGITVSNGIDAAEMFESEYVDIIERWKASVIREVLDESQANIEGWKETESGKLRAIIYENNSEMQAALDVERARIDAFTALEDGSTTGDAELQDIRISADGTTYESAGTAVREQFNRITDNEETIAATGRTHLSGPFEHGLIDNTGAEFPGKHRVRSAGFLQYARDITLYPASGFRYGLQFYNENHVTTGESGWQTAEYTIPANTIFRIVISKTPEDTSISAVIRDFVKAIEITTALTETEKRVEYLENSYIFHASADKQPKTTVTSNNLADPAKFEAGGYYAFDTGKWAARSDITSTGLIPCEKGQTYFCGITFADARGGNCTYWDANGQYVSGVNIADGRNGFVIPDNDNIAYMRLSFYANEESKYHVNRDAYTEYDAYKIAYSFDGEIMTPTANTETLPNTLYYTSAYRDDVTVLHKRNNRVGTSYQVVIINETKFDGTKTKAAIAGTSDTNPLGDANITNVQTFAKKHDFLHVINGGIYLVADYVADGITIIDGKILKSSGVEQFNVEQYVLGITAGGEFKTYRNTAAADILKDGCVYALTGFVPMIEDGEAVSDAVLAVCPHYNVRHPRQIVGTLADGNYFTFCCDGRTEGENGMTLRECIDTLMLDFDVSFAFDLDGGGSTQTAVGKKQINRMIDGRKVPNVITFK